MYLPTANETLVPVSEHLGIFEILDEIKAFKHTFQQ